MPIKEFGGEMLCAVLCELLFTPLTQSSVKPTLLTSTLGGGFSWDAWVAQSVKHLTLDPGSGRELEVCGIKPCIWLHAASTEPAWDSLSPSLCPSPTCSLSLPLCLKIN